MAMNAENLANEIKAKYDAIKPEGAGLADAVFCKALAEAIVTHIQTNAKATGVDTPAGNNHNLSIS